MSDFYTKQIPWTNDLINIGLIFVNIVFVIKKTLNINTNNIIHYNKKYFL